MRNRSPRQDDEFRRLIGTPPPGWELWRERMRASGRSDAGREAGLWALDVLEELLGPTWPEMAGKREGAIPAELLYSSSHAVAFAELVELALRLQLLRDVPGIAPIKRGLRGDLRGEFRAHARIQLQVSALARRLGWEVAMEAPGLNGRPVDVIVRRPTGSLAVETFVVMMDEDVRLAQAYDQEISRQLLDIQIRHDVVISGEMLARLTSADTGQWLRVIEAVALEVVADGIARPVDHPASRVRVLPGRGVPSGTTFTGPTALHKGWPRTAARLAEKAEKARAAGARWLRADVLDGLWQFTPWAQEPLVEKTQELAAATSAALSHVEGLDGAVLSSGLAFAQGSFAGESCRTRDEAIGLRRPVDPVRVRELIVTPLSPRGADQAADWISLYDAEDGWFEWALGEVGLGSGDDVLGWREARGAQGPTPEPS